MDLLEPELNELGIQLAKELREGDKMVKHAYEFCEQFPETASIAFVDLMLELKKLKADNATLKGKVDDLEQSKRAMGLMLTEFLLEESEGEHEQACELALTK